MLLLVASEKDMASVNIRDKLLEMANWREAGLFEDGPTYSHGDFRMLTLNQEHLSRDNVNVDAERCFHEAVEVVIYLSRHSSESGHKSLTIHPIGNFHKADFGGRPGVLVPASPGLMTGVLRSLRKCARGLEYAVSLEATHHGPYLNAPTFFIETGSDMTSWSDPKAAGVIATALLFHKKGTGKVGVGVGGGHYMPRITDVALTRDVCFGHMVPSYALNPFEPELLQRAITGTPGVQFAYIHRKALDKSLVKSLEDWFKGHGIEVLREGELPLLG